MAMYVHAVYLFKSQILPEPFFWIFAVTFSISVMLLWDINGNRKILLMLVFTSAFVIVSILFFRFYFYGADLVGEYAVADLTRELGRWTPEKVTGVPIRLDWHFHEKADEFLHRYFASITVTILPAIVSEVAGLPMKSVIWTLLSVVSATAVMVGFSISKMCFGQRIAALSSIIFVFSSFYIGKFATILREGTALLALLLATLYILKTGRKYLFISLIFLIFVPMSHYGLVYFAFLFLLLLLLSGKVHDNEVLTSIMTKLNPNLSNDFDERTTISGNLVLYSIVGGVCWLLFAAYPIFMSNLEGFAESFKALLGLAPARYSYFQGHIFFSSLGLFNTAVQWLERVMAGIGFFLALKTCKSHKAFSFIFLGGGLLATGIALAFLPNISSLFDLGRTMQVGLLGFSVFIAVTVLRISQRNNLGKISSILLVSLILLETLHSPLLYSSASNLSRKDYIFSFTHVVSFYEFSDFTFAKWAESFTDRCDVFAADAIGSRLCLIAKRTCVEPRGVNVSDTISLLESGKTKYFLVLSYLPNYMSFGSEKGGELELNSTEISKLLGSNHLNRIYDNSRVTNFGYVA